MRNKLEDIVAGQYKLSEKDRLRLDLKLKNIPPLPSGEEALTPTTKAGWQTESR